MKTISQYKNDALRSLEGKWTTAAVATLIYLVLYGVFGQSYGFIFDQTVTLVLGGITMFLFLPLAWGILVFFLRLIRNEDLAYEHLFDGYRQFVRIFVAELLKVIYVILWALLLIIPGIIKQYSYAMTEFILKDNPEMTGEEAICESMRIMQGHKMQLFLLDLSMIGWVILSVLTLGIGFIFLLPYNYTAHAHFYEDIKQ